MFIAKLCSTTANEITDLYKIIEIYTMIYRGRNNFNQKNAVWTYALIPLQIYQQKVDVKNKNRNHHHENIMFYIYILLRYIIWYIALFSKIILNFTYMCRKDLHYAVFFSECFYIYIHTRMRYAYAPDTFLFAIRNFHKYNKVNKSTKI